MKDVVRATIDPGGQRDPRDQRDPSIVIRTNEPSERRRAQRFSPDFQALLALSLAGDDLALQQNNRIERVMLATQPPPGRVDYFPIRVLVNELRQAEGPEAALESWSSFLERRRSEIRDGRGIPERHLAAFDISDAAIADIFSQVGKAKADGAADAKRLAEERAAEDDGTYRRYAEPTVDRRSLKGLNTNGMEVAIEGIPDVEISPDDSEPVLLQVRHRRIATINGFDSSYVNHSIHDAVDHWATFQVLDELGWITQFKSFFDEIGNSQDKNIYNLGGELPAQVLYVWRNSHNIERPVARGVSIDELRGVLQETRNTGRSTQNQDDAYDIISGLDPDSQEAVSLEALYSGTITEMIGLQRKFRPIPRYGEDGERIGDFPLDHPEYLAFIVKMNRFLHENGDEVRLALLNVNLIIEDYLRNRGESAEPLIITMDDLRRPVEETIAETNIPPQVVEWFGVGTNLFRTGLNEDRHGTIGVIK